MYLTSWDFVTQSMFPAGIHSTSAPVLSSMSPYSRMKEEILGSVWTILTMVLTSGKW